MDYKKAIDILDCCKDYDDSEQLSAINIAIEVLEKQAFFENEVSNIHGWFVDNKESLLDSAMGVTKEGFEYVHVNGYIDKVDLDSMVEDIVDEIQKGILNVLSTYMGEYDA